MYFYYLVNPTLNERKLKSLKNLQELNTRGTNIKGNDGKDCIIFYYFKYIYIALYNQNTELLNLNDFISDEGRKLNLGSIYIKFYSIFFNLEMGIDYNRSLIINNELVKYPYLRDLNLKINSISDNSIKVISDAIQFLHYLEIINLSYNYITDYGLIYFASKIKHLQYLKRIDIRCMILIILYIYSKLYQK